MNHSQMLAKAAKWMYDRKDAVDYWRWQVLSDMNINDPSAPKFPAKKAAQVFGDLVRL